MTEIASLNLSVDSSQVKQATVALNDLPKAASAAERAAQKWGLATDVAARSSDDFSKRVQGVIRNLDFERQQLTRNSTEQARFTALRRAGVSAASAEGQAITASVAALTAQRAATKAASEATTLTGTATKAAGAAYRGLVEPLKFLIAGYVGVEAVRKVWEAGMKAGDIGEQAEQVNLSTDALQAYRFEAVQNGVSTEQLDQGMIRLTATMGAAARGGKDQIEMFQKLGVKLLDAKGELRATGDVLPELARGLLNVGSETERNATLTEMFGKSGARMVTMLKSWAQGSDSVVESARAQGGILESDVIDIWDKVSDAMKRAGAASDVTLAKIGAPIALESLNAVERVLKSINGLMDEIEKGRARGQGFWLTVLDESRRNGRIGSGPNALRLETPEEENARVLAEKQKELGSPAAEGRQPAIQAEIDKMKQAAALDAQIRMQADDADARRGRLPVSQPLSGGARDPTVKASGTDPYTKIIASAKTYMAQKIAETQAIGLSADAAARLTHEQELLGKAAQDNITLGPAQIAQLKALAGAMADADAAFKTAKFMDDLSTNTQDFVQSQQLEQQALFMSAEAAARARYEHEGLVKAKQAGIDQNPAVVAAIQESAAAMAAAGEKTRQLKEVFDLAKDTFRGFFTDMKQGLMDGQSVWQSFGNAAINALNKIADKLLEMAADKLFEAAFGGSPGTSSAGGGAISGLISGAISVIGGLFGGGGGFSPGLPTTPGMGTVNAALGRVYDRGNVIPFARGGIVGSPTLFPMANGAGLMGEAGPEAVMPLKRGPGGSLGVAVHGGNGNSSMPPVTVVMNNQFGSDVSRAEMDARLVQVEASAKKGAIAGIIEIRRNGGRKATALGGR